MGKTRFQPVDQQWFDQVYREYEIDPAQPLPERRSTAGSELDLSARDFVTTFDLLTLLLLVDHLHYYRGTVNLQFFRPGSPRSSAAELERPTYKFLGFLENFGFFASLRQYHKEDRVTFSGISASLLDGIGTYSGVTRDDTKVLSLLPIRAADDTSAFRSQKRIDYWLKGLPPEIRAAPVFADGEFSRVFGYQLAMNIVQHAGFEQRDATPRLGAVSMRVLPCKHPLPTWLTNSYPPPHTSAFDPTNKRGVLEICVGDSGCGLQQTLHSACSAMRRRFGLSDNPTARDIIAFAFDEQGTSKPPEDRWGGVHALHRLLRSTQKYRGTLRLRSAGYEFVFDMSHDQNLSRGAANLGYLPERGSTKHVMHPHGVQIQILLPLTNPERKVYAFGPALRAVSSLATTDPPKIVVASSAFLQKPQPDEIRKHLASLVNVLTEEPETRTIVFDFGGYEWEEEQFAHFLHSQEHVLHARRCIGLDVPRSLLRPLREREKLNPDEEHIDEFGIRDFFEVLSTKHCLLPLFDTQGDLLWLGLGRYEWDDALTYMFEEQAPARFETICSKARLSEGSPEVECLELYLKTNHHLFEHSRRGTDSFWQCMLHVEDVNSCRRTLVRSRIADLLQEHKCVHGLDDDAVYKLPSHTGFARRFIQTSPLLQDECSLDQVSQWILAALREKLPRNNGPILLVACTASSELLARGIANACWDRGIHLLNLGHGLSRPDETVLHYDDWKMPVVIVADVIDRFNTVKKIVRRLRTQGFEIMSVVTLLKFVDGVTIQNDGPRSLIEEQLPNEEASEPVPVYIMSEWERPEQISDAAARCYPDDKRFYVDAFSLQPFRYSSLASSQRNSAKHEEYGRKMQLLDAHGALRIGHWVYGSHHFAATTSVSRFLQLDEVGGAIAREIIDICDARQIDHILLPLHSHVADLLPRIIAGVARATGHHISCSLCVESRDVAERPFYLVPNSLDSFFERCKARRESGGAAARILIIDDAVATSRTIETMIRSLIRKAAQLSKMDLPCLESLNVYAILDRQGQARGTWWKAVRSVALEVDDITVRDSDGGALLFDFEFDRWIELEPPVTDLEACTLCHERDDLLAIKDNCGLPSDHPVVALLQARISGIKPRSTESPAFNTDERRTLPETISIGGSQKASSVELALWEFYSLVHRGHPMEALVDAFDATSDLVDRYKNDLRASEYLQLLLEEFGRCMLRRWRRLRSQWGTDQWIAAFSKCIGRGDRCSRWILAEAGRALATADENDSSLENFFVHTVQTICDTTGQEVSDIDKLRCLADGCAMFLLAHRFFDARSRSEIRSANVLSQVSQRLLDVLRQQIAHQMTADAPKVFLQDILQVGRRTVHVDTFVPALLTVCDHTIRYARHQAHSHLLPFGLEEMSSGHTPLELGLRRTWSNHIVEFLHCLRILANRGYSLFDRDSAAEIDGLDVLLSDLVDALEESHRTDDLPGPELLATAGLARSVFPASKHNRIYLALRKTHVHLGELLDDVAKASSSRGIHFVCHQRCDNALFEAYILAQSKEAIKQVLLNFSAEADVQTDDACILADVEACSRSKSPNTVKLTLYSELGVEKTQQARLSVGPGMAELGAHMLQLFGIAGHHPRFEVTGPDGRTYAVAISIDFVCGFQLESREKNDGLF